MSVKSLLCAVAAVAAEKKALAVVMTAVANLALTANAANLKTFEKNPPPQAGFSLSIFIWHLH